MGESPKSGTKSLLVQLRDSEDAFRLLVEGVTDYAIFMLDPAGRIVSWNAGAERIKGYSADEVLGRHFSLFYPRDEVAAGKPDRELRIACAEGRYQEEGWRIRKDGLEFWADVTITPLFDAAGELRGYGKVTRDITERKRAEEHQQLLAAELSHRVKNTLAVVQAIAAQTLRRASSLAGFAEAFSGRLQALAAAHELLIESNWRSANLKALVRHALKALGTSQRAIDVSGPDLELTPKQTLGLSLILHELATNAAKYGALSVPAGRLKIAWAVGESDAGARLRLNWVERGGPAVGPARADGFGTTLIRRTATYNLDGKAKLRFDPGGLQCRIVFPWAADREPVAA